MEAARQARPGDRAEIAFLAVQGTGELTPNRGGLIWSLREGHADPAAAIDAVLSDPDPRSVAVVGTIDEQVVGYGLMRIEDLHDGRTLAAVSDLYVDPAARGVGVGEAMMDMLVEQATAAGAIGIDALALPGDRHTKNFFETFGLVARAILVHRSLAPVDPDER